MSRIPVALLFSFVLGLGSVLGSVSKRAASSPEDMRTMAFWAEGLKGQVHLQIKSVKATDCTNLTKLSGEPKSEHLLV